LLHDCSYLRILDLGSSGFKGTIPAGVYKLTKLTTLDFSGNQFHDAPIPNAISNLVNLEYVLEWATLGDDDRVTVCSGTASAARSSIHWPVVLPSRRPSCRYFDASDNKNIKGTIPAVLGKLTKLE